MYLLVLLSFSSSVYILVQIVGYWIFCRLVLGDQDVGLDQRSVDSTGHGVVPFNKNSSFNTSYWDVLFWVVLSPSSEGSLSGYEFANNMSFARDDVSWLHFFLCHSTPNNLTTRFLCFCSLGDSCGFEEEFFEYIPHHESCIALFVVEDVRFRILRLHWYAKQ